MSLFKGRATNVAVIQFKVLQDDRDTNLATATQLIQGAAGQGANLICLPATFATGLNFPSVKRMAEPLDGHIVEALQEQAQRLKLVVCAGLLEAAGRDIFDSAVVIGQDGRLAGSYRRACVWEGEGDFISRGEGGHVIETELGRLGLLVSYDLRFPEACRGYFAQDADIIVCVASLFSRYALAVESLCRARAAENSCGFVFASGLGANRLAMMEYMGRSLIVDGTVDAEDGEGAPDVLARAGTREEVLQAPLFARELRKRRKDLPLLEDYKRLWMDEPDPVLERAR
ncbi:carbon-nitrogen hydrolase family protein [Myxococcus sp. K15C18031901]|uniref:carbon-nitrogen hydrolase family protein n=1 Tax=Myxococcus dinghuensis TaxID=2906761 RepID=UPI0020A6F4FD|nr:carbon-nitrogen hydrolase family protein [Myxococcus dinghuensis]MCP3098093.1 carbon-nitrogen hydrolase family protein [Myxococcus dinghuensis]